MLDFAEVRELVTTPKIQELVERVLGRKGVCVRGILFDKKEDANWALGWHQDEAVAVNGSTNAEGWRGFSMKEGVPHALPPAELLESMVAVRLHLDDCPKENGALLAIAGSHTSGFVGGEERGRLVNENEVVVCECLAGDAVVIRPLCLHASGKAEVARHRRVLHLEFCGVGLPEELEWYWSV